VEEKKEVKKLDDIKETPENKKAVAEANGEVVVEDKVEETKVEETKAEEKKEDVKEEKSNDKKSEPAVAKVSKKDKKVEGKVELEREYVIPLKKGVLKVPQYKRAKRAVKVIREFLVRHMKVEDRDVRKVKIDRYLNNEIWFRGIKKPMNKVKVKAKKIDGVVYVELAEIPEAVKFIMARDEKKKSADAKVKTKMPKKGKEKEDADKDKDGVADKVEEKEDAKSGAEKSAKVEAAAVKTQKHTAQGAHLKKTAPVRKSLKK